MNYEQAMIESIKRRYPEGTRIKLEHMKGEPDMSSALRGSVDFVDDIGQIHVRWDNGRGLALNIQEDIFSKLTPGEIASEQQALQMDSQKFI